MRPNAAIIVNHLVASNLRVRARFLLVFGLSNAVDGMIRAESIIRAPYAMREERIARH